MARNSFTRIIHRSLGFSEANEFCGHDSPLVHQLVKAVLSICARLSKNDWTSVHSIVKSGSILSDCFAVAFHIKLLDVSRESKESLAVGEYSTRLNPAYVSVVEPDHAEE